jgi:acyl-CoA reductase-like NAD-dependent aldehyde dehydrogenase
MRIDCTNLINGEWIPTSDTVDNRCPANTDELLGTAPNSGEAEALAAIEAAKAALPGWRDETTAPQRLFVPLGATA